MTQIYFYIYIPKSQLGSLMSFLKTLHTEISSLPFESHTHHEQICYYDQPQKICHQSNAPKQGHQRVLVKHWWTTLTVVIR